MNPHSYGSAAILMLLLLGGCATFSEDGGTRAVHETVRERGIVQDIAPVRNAADANRVRDTVRDLLTQSLTADAAVQIALLNNRGLQASYAELGIAEAELVQAGRLRNPGFSFERIRGGGVVEIDRTFMFDVLGLLTMPIRTDLERRRFELAQGRLALQILQVAADTRRAWINAVAAQQTVAYAEQVQAAAEAAAELARRMALAGNFSKLDRAREQSFYADAATQLARARLAAAAARERLNRLLGLWGDDLRYTLPARLPDLPQTAQLPELISDPAQLEQRAMALRLDVQGAMKQAENIAAAMGLVRATGFIDVLEVGYRHDTATGEPRQTGYAIELRLPIFDFGSAKVARAEQIYLQAVHRAADIAVRARSEVREAHGAWRTAFDLARHYRDEVIPLRTLIGEETLLRYNGMLASVFDLLAESRRQSTAVIAAITTQRDFWIADTALRLAITGQSSGAADALAAAAPGADGQAAAPAH